jgi:hypothetical protein
MTETVNAEIQASDSSACRDLPKAGQSSKAPNWTMSYERLSGFLQS